MTQAMGSAPARLVLAAAHHDSDWWPNLTAPQAAIIVALILAVTILWTAYIVTDDGRR